MRFTNTEKCGFPQVWKATCGCTRLLSITLTIDPIIFKISDHQSTLVVTRIQVHLTVTAEMVGCIRCNQIRVDGTYKA